MARLGIIGRDLPLSEVRGKRVLLRIDLNVPLESGVVSDNLRLQMVLPTLRLLQEGGARIIIMGHVGRPRGKIDRAFSLLPVRDCLEDLLGCEIAFAGDCVGGEAELVSSSLADGEIGMLENLRFESGEVENSRDFSMGLASLGDIYVNEAFSVSHRLHASIVGVGEFLPSYAGLSLADEVFHLHEICSSPNRPLALVIGGSKISSKIEIIENLLSRVQFLVIGGAMANTFLLARGFSVGASLVERDHCHTAASILSRAASFGVEVILPTDVVVSDSLGGAGRNLAVGSVGGSDMILDIGSVTVSNIFRILSECRTVLWNGPLGAFEHAGFGDGTFSCMSEVARLTGAGVLRSVGGGGDTAYALRKAGVREGFTYVSGAGGAFLAYLEGKDLVGIEMLKATSNP